ncbi:hypothetical protein CEP51_012320 [Fusarium floridanum]|uniref:Uncharacterized protein n=1 Tax=Fusarium floridanum TaxID=1325733 RepID=A0A428QWJ3_9HYPO|nr:hypothetical protein CEP51_012320 [Fusarium floridanum]
MPTATALTGHTATITNFGPLTTTYSAPTSCSTATDHLYIGLTKEPGILWGYPTCHGVQTFGDCIPSGDAFDKLMTDVYAKIIDHGFYHYYSPGLYCPSGWTTAAALVNEGGSFTEISGYLTRSYTNWLGRWEPGRAQPSDPGEVWKQALLPSETLKICCPSGFEGDNNGDCYSVLGPLSSYGVTEICGYYAEKEPTPIGTQTVHNSTITQWETVALTTVTRVLETGAYKDDFVVTRVPAVALIHKEPDLELS